MTKALIKLKKNQEVNSYLIMIGKYQNYLDYQLYKSNNNK